MVLTYVSFIYIEASNDQSHQQHQYLFKLQSKGENLIFSAQGDSERMSWLRTLYLATGQAVKPSGIEEWNWVTLGNKEQRMKREGS